eukprot:m.34104 g.34104  ORF g.34104 m.34104 type:complete len:176 (-) comp10629_c0_seq1:125-652(-)
MAAVPPNILVVGTPGTGKTTLCNELADRTDMSHIDVSELVKQRELYEGFDEEFQSYVIDEDKVLDEMEDESDLNITAGGKVVSYHGCDFFPERFFQLVVVLRTDNTVLYDRLAARGYSAHKIQENVQAEIMQVLLEEAHENYNPDIVVELQSDTPEDMEANLERIQSWLESFSQK